MSDDANILIINGERYRRQDSYAAHRKVHPRTIARKRESGLPFLEWGGIVWIPEVAGDRFIAASVKKRRVPTRRARADQHAT
jgi:hypothetical protein